MHIAGYACQLSQTYEKPRRAVTRRGFIRSIAFTTLASAMGSSGYVLC
jgi:hypothetical protein